LGLTGLLVVALLALAVGASVERTGEPIPPLPRLGPVQEVDTADVADPFILPVAVRAGGALLTRYLRFATNDRRSNVATATSTDLVHWQAVPDALPMLPAWAAPSFSMTWAPAVLAVGGYFLLYVTTEEAGSGLQCIALAESATPEGPYLDSSARPFLCQRSLGGSIDPTVVRSGDGHLALVWKNDGNCCGLPTRIWEQDLSGDGLRLVGPARPLLSADQAWEHGNIEAPALMPAAGHGWWLFFSGGDWRTPDYATGIAFCDTLHGPCRQALDRPFLSTSPDVRTPGGLETFHDGAGRTWAAFSSTVLIPSRRFRRHVFVDRVLDIAPILPG
jgi:hypothetical protein